MKTNRIFALVALFASITTYSFAQKTVTEKVPVSGNCGMCKNKIEKAARGAGATSAYWNKDTKVLTVKYSSSTTDLAKIQQNIAAAGYDTRDVKASDEAYNKLDACCQYDRTGDAKAGHQCSADCQKNDGKCADMESCKAKGCCKEGAACKDGACCKKS